MSNAEFKSYYTALRAQGRSHVEALLIVARKLVRIMFALTRREEQYDPQRVHLAGVVG